MTEATPAHPRDGRRGFWIRLAASAIDAVVFLVFAVTIGVAESVMEERGQLTEAKQRGFEGMLLALWLAYTSMEALIGATAGKLATGIVITLPDGAPAPPWTRVLRWATKQCGVILGLCYALTGQGLFWVVAGIFNLVLVVGCLRVLDEDRRAWHDYWSHTAVFSRKRAAELRDLHEEPQGPPPPT